MLTPTIFKSYGFRIDAGIPDVVLERCIEEAQQWYAARYFKSDNYMTLVNTSNDDPIMKGGVVTNTKGKQVIIAGFLKAAAHIAYACLLQDYGVASTFSTVRKKDDHSENIDPWDLCKYHDTIGRGWMREVAEVKGWSQGETGGYFTETCKL